MTLYPIIAEHTRPLIRGIAKALARCDAMGDLFSDSDIVLTNEHVHNNALEAFKRFCESQGTEELTDDIEILQRMYVDAYEGMYRQRYAEVIANLEKMAVSRPQ